MANPVMLWIYLDRNQNGRPKRLVGSAWEHLPCQLDRIFEKILWVVGARANRLEIRWDYPPVVGQGHLWVVTATSTTKACFRQV